MLGYQYNLKKKFKQNFYSGLSVSLVLFPFEAMKKLLQVSGFKFLLTDARESLKKFMNLSRTYKFEAFRGCPIFCLNIIPTTFIQLLSNDLLEPHVPKGPNEQYWRYAKDMGCGMFGATFATIVEGCITRQTMLQCNFLKALRTIASQGIFKLWTSYPLIAMRDGIFTSFLFGIKPRFNEATKGRDPVSTLALSICLNTSGAVISHPFDTIATNKQKAPQLSAREIVQQLYAKAGIRAFLTGLGPRIILFNGFLEIIPRVKQRITA